MVGVGPKGIRSALARATIVNSHGHILYDQLVKVPERITDYRTQYSGIRRGDLIGAPPFAQVQKEVAALMKDRTVVGHGLHNDFNALKLSHPSDKIRDTSSYGPLQRSKGKPRRLRYLTQALFDLEIQNGEHNPAEDARAAMLVYKSVKVAWEKGIMDQKQNQQKMNSQRLKKKSNRE